ATPRGQPRELAPTQTPPRGLAGRRSGDSRRQADRRAPPRRPPPAARHPPPPRRPRARRALRCRGLPPRALRRTARPARAAVGWMRDEEVADRQVVEIPLQERPHGIIRRA